MQTERSTRGCCTLLAACCLALVSADAHGQQAGDVARLDAAVLKGRELTRAGNYDQAIELLQKVMELAPSVYGANSTSMATCLDELASAYTMAGQAARAEPLYQRSLKLYEANLGKDHPNVAQSVTNLGDLYRLTQQYAKAEPLYQRSLQIREAKLGKDHPDVASVLNNMGMLYHNMAQYAKAVPLHQRSLQIWEAKLGKDHPDVAMGLHNLATVYQDMGQRAKAEPLYQRSLQIWEAKLGKDHPHVAINLWSLAGLYQAMGQYAKAEPLYQRSLQITEAKLGKDHPEVAFTLNSLAELYRLMGQYPPAEALCQRSLQIREAKLGKDHPEVGNTLFNMALLYQAMGQYARAESLFQRSLQIREAKLGKDFPLLAKIHSCLGTLHAAQEQWMEAAIRFDQSRRNHVSYCRTALPSLGAREQLNLLDTFVRHVDAPLSLAHLRRQDRKIVELSAGWVLNGKGLTQEALAQGLHRQPGQTAEPDRWTELDRVRQAMPGDAILIEVARFRLDDFRDMKYQNLPLRYAVWLIPPMGQGQVELIDLGPAEPIDQAVAAFRRAIGEAPAAIRAEGEPEAEKKALKALQGLSQLVLEPMREKIGSAKQWLVSPDAALWLVPWGALPLADGSYAVEKHTIRYLISGRELVKTATASKPGRARIIADPDFDLAPATARTELQKLAANIQPSSELRAAPLSLQLANVRRLPGTRAEAEAIKPRLDQITGQETWLYQDRQALEGIVKRIRNPKVLVLSTHGFFMPDQEVAAAERTGSDNNRAAITKDGKPLENPLLRCGLLLAGCNRRDQATQASDDDGILTGLEITGLDLRGTELVVLSACETGLGQVRNGEGVAGLRQAFQLAGARSVLATLWQIPDLETARLMSDFFGQLADKKGNAEALREAQLAMIKARRERNGAAHPFFWAAFTLTGGAR